MIKLINILNELGINNPIQIELHPIKNQSDVFVILGTNFVLFKRNKKYLFTTQYFIPNDNEFEKIKLYLIKRGIKFEKIKTSYFNVLGIFDSQQNKFKLI